MTNVSFLRPSNTIYIWDIGTQEMIYGPFSRHTGPVISITFSQDGKRVVSYSLDKLIRIWNVEEDEPALPVHHGAVSPFALEPRTSL